MNYCPNCGFCLKDPRMLEREKDPFSTYYKGQFPPPGTVIPTNSPPFVFYNYPEQPYTTTSFKGALNGTETRTKG